VRVALACGEGEGAHLAAVALRQAAARRPVSRIAVGQPPHLIKKGVVVGVGGEGGSRTGCGVEVKQCKGTRQQEA
jgi:hypothetical protein